MMAGADLFQEETKKAEGRAPSASAARALAPGWPSCPLGPAGTGLLPSLTVDSKSRTPHVRTWGFPSDGSAGRAVSILSREPIAQDF